MLAALISLTIFAYCTILGLALIAALGSEEKPYLPLLAPALGAACCIIPAIWLSELGVPMARGGPILLGTLLAAALFSLVRWRRRLRLRGYWPFAAILFVGFLLAAWPIFEFGFNWVSYANDDMVNYVLNAERLVELGWFTVPSYTAFNFNRDPSTIYWNWTVYNERFGSEMSVTLALSIFKHNGFQLFMPVMAALGLMQISAAAALVYHSEKFRAAALLTAGLMAICALTTFALEYQLLSQVFGISLLVASVALLCDLPEALSWRSILLCAISIAGMSMVYPEASPFLIFGAALYYGVLAFQKKLEWRAARLWLVCVGLVTTLLLNEYLRNYLSVVFRRLLDQAGGADHRIIELFPFYLLPSGLAMFFGIYSSVQGIAEPWLSIGIFLGLILLALTATLIVRGSRSPEPAACVGVVMLILGALLFFKQNGFGLFKEAMYAQPFLIATLTIWLAKPTAKVARRAMLVSAVLLCVVLNLQTQHYYVDRSRGGWTEKGATFLEIPNASASHLLDEFAQLPHLAGPSTTFISDTSNVVFGKIEAYFAKPTNIIYPSGNFLPGLFVIPNSSFERALIIPWMLKKAVSMSVERQRFVRRPYFLFRDDYGVTRLGDFFANASIPRLFRRPEDVVFLEDTAAQSVVNRWNTSNMQKNFEAVRLDHLRNHLIFVSSRYGLDYNARGKYVALYQLEPDLFYHGETMAGMGRRVLFEVINPSPKVRLELNYSVTLRDDDECILDDPSIRGAGMDPQFAHVIGRGSARIFLPAVTPRILTGQSYVFLDMNVNGVLFPFPRTGLMNLYGRNIPLDGRLLVGFARDISAISEQEYQHLRPPSLLTNLRAALRDRNLEYSGAYEDGWISEASFYGLSHRDDQRFLTVSGMVPFIGDSNFHFTLRVLAGEREVGRAELGVGRFAFAFPVGRLGPRVRVKLLFDRFQRLPLDDRRPVAGQLYTVGFLTAAQAARLPHFASWASTAQSKWLRVVDKRIDFGEGWYEVESYDGQTFKWASNDARLVVRGRTTQRTRLVLDAAPGPGEGGSAGVLHLLDSGGRELGAATISQRQTVSFPLEAVPGPQTYVLHIDHGGAVTPSDPRILNFRVFSVSLR